MPQTSVHPLALVEDGARLGAGVEIGPFCHVGKDVVLGDGVRLVSHVTVVGLTTVGEGTVIHPQAGLGGPPQDKKYRGGATTLSVGRNCIIREGATIHRGTETGRGATTVGDDAYIMTYCHVGHDCNVGNGVTMASNASLAGHADIGDGVIISGYAAVHQNVRVGHHAFLAGFAAVVGDVIPYGMAIGDRARLKGFNVVGLKRSGMARSDLHLMRRAYRLLFSPERSLAENVPLVEREFGHSPVVADILSFITSRGKRAFTVPGRKDREDDDGDD